nr:shieldin complex subunit 1 isoform X8 [Globicephala melas]
MSTTACDWVSSNERCLARTMANQEATTGSQSEESNALDLPSAYDIRDYVLQRPSQEANSEAFSSEEAFSIPCSSDTDPGRSHCLGRKTSYLSKTVGRDFKGQPPWWNQDKELFPGGLFV